MSESHAQLPPDVLAAIDTIPSNRAHELYCAGQRLLEQGRSITLIAQPSESVDSTREWLSQLPGFRPTSVATVVWNLEHGVSLPWRHFVESWDNFCYPSSDDLFVFADGSNSALAYRHFDQIQLLENAV